MSQRLSDSIGKCYCMFKRVRHTKPLRKASISKCTEFSHPQKSDLPSHYILFLIEVSKDTTTRFLVCSAVTNTKGRYNKSSNRVLSIGYGSTIANVYGITSDYRNAWQCAANLLSLSLSCSAMVDARRLFPVSDKENGSKCSAFLSSRFSK